MCEVKMVKNSDKLVCLFEKFCEYFINYFGFCEVKIFFEIFDFESYLYVFLECEIVVDEFFLIVEEVKSVFLKFNNGKVIGIDGFVVEFLKYNDCFVLVELVIELLINVWNGGEVFDSWKYFCVWCFFKNKGFVFDFLKYRGLSINLLLNKVFMIIVLDRMKEFYEFNIMFEQYGFRFGVGIVDGIFVVKRLIKMMLGYFNVCFIDL